MRDNHVSSTTPEEKNVAVVERKDRVARCYFLAPSGSGLRWLVTLTPLADAWQRGEVGRWSESAFLSLRYCPHDVGIAKKVKECADDSNDDDDDDEDGVLDLCRSRVRLLLRNDTS
jgi:hypothetical protein